MITPQISFRRITPSFPISMVLVAVCAISGCQSPNFMSGLNSRKPPVQQASATKEAGLPEPTNTATSNSPISLTSADEHLQLGEQELQNGNFQQAQTHFDQVLTKHPDHSKAHHRLGVLADKLGQFPQAEEHYLTALNSDPRNAALLSDLGYSYFMQGRYPDSERYLLEARRLDPNYETAVANLGLLYGSTGRQQEAVAMLRQIGDESQVQAIMQQIAGGKYSPTDPASESPFAGPQSTVVTTQTSVKSAAEAANDQLNLDQMNDATRNFVEEMRKAREDLRRAEEQFALQQQQQQAQQQMQQPSSASANSHQFGPGNVQNAWGPDPSQQPGPDQFAYQQQHSPQGYAATAAWQQQPAHNSTAGRRVPDSELADMMASIDRRDSSARQDGAIVVGGTDPHGHQQTTNTDSSGAYAQMPGMAGPTDRRPAPRFDSDRSSAAVPVYTGPVQQSATQMPPVSTGVPANSMGQGQQNPAHWDQQPTNQNFSQAAGGNAQQPASSAWQQQFATSLGQSTPGPGQTQQSAGNHPGMIQPAGGYGSSQQPIEHAYHTQQSGQTQNIALTGQHGAADPSLVPPSLNSNWAQQNQHQGPAQQTADASGQPSANAYEQARRQAALLGLNAGPGQVFPYIQQTQRVMPGTDSRINGSQYPSPARHMPSGLIPADLNPALASPQPGNLAPRPNNQGQPMPSVPAQTYQQSSYAAPSGASFSQYQQNNGPAQSSPGADAYQTTRDQQSAQLNGLVNQTWGQSPQSPPYGVTPPSTTQQYGSATQFNPSASNTSVTPYYQRSEAGNAGQTVPAGYQSPHANGNPAPASPGGMVVPAPYPSGQAATNNQWPGSHGQSAGVQSYAPPMIVPARR